MTCFRSRRLRPGDALLLGFAAALAGVALRLSVTARAEGIGVDPQRPPLVVGGVERRGLGRGRVSGTPPAASTAPARSC